MELRGIVPAIVPAPPPELFAVQVIIVDWLYREVDGLAEIKMPVLLFRRSSLTATIFAQSLPPQS